MAQAYEYFVTTPPVNDVLTVQELKDWMRVDVVDDDTLIASLRDAVVDYAQRYTHRTMLTTVYQTFRDDLDGNIVLRKSPFDSAVTVVLEYLVDGTWTTLTQGTDFYVIYSNKYAYLMPVGSAWPSNIDDRPQAVRISFTSGYGANSGDIPFGLRQAMLEHCSFLYDNRGDNSKNRMDAPPQAHMAYCQFRIVEFS